MNTTNTNLTFLGSPLKVSGVELKVGDSLPKFKLTGPDMQDVTSDRFAGRILIITAVPSLDTPVCQVETRRFNDEVTKLSDDVTLLAVSADLPFAQKRWCGAEGVSRVEVASDYKYRNFGESFGAYLPDVALLARAVFVADRAGKLVHVEYVQELSHEPDYDTAIKMAATLS